MAGRNNRKNPRNVVNIPPVPQEHVTPVVNPTGNNQPPPPQYAMPPPPAMAAQAAAGGQNLQPQANGGQYLPPAPNGQQYIMVPVPANAAPPAPQQAYPAGGYVQTGAPNIIIPKQDDEFTVVFPTIREHLDDKTYPVKGTIRGIARTVGFSNAFEPTIESILRETIYHADFTHRDGPLKDEPLYASPAEIPQQFVDQIRNEVNRFILTNDHYQSVVSLTSKSDKFLGDWVSKGEATAAFYGLRNSGNGKKSSAMSFFDKLMHGELAWYGFELGHNVYHLAQVHAEHENVMGITTELVKNKYLDGSLFYTVGMHIGLPIAADIVEGGHPIDNGIEMTKHLGEFFRIKPGHEQKAGAVQAVSSYVASSYAPRSNDLVAKMKKYMDENKDGMTGQVLHVLQAEEELMGSIGTLGIRLAHAAFTTAPFQTSFFARATYKHAAQNHLQMHYGVK